MTKSRIMVVDNELDICNFVKSFFEVRGYLVSTALNGDEAMAKIGKEKPELILLDMMMRREKEGLEYLPRLKEALPLARILMVTGVDDADSMEEAKRLGADDYITKPLVLEYLENTVLGKIKDLSTAA
jgi:DNA-binding response OmpR family regulator